MNPYLNLLDDPDSLDVDLAGPIAAADRASLPDNWDAARRWRRWHRRPLTTSDDE